MGKGGQRELKTLRKALKTVYAAALLFPAQFDKWMVL